MWSVLAAGELGRARGAHKAPLFALLPSEATMICCNAGSSSTRWRLISADDASPGRLADIGQAAEEVRWARRGGELPVVVARSPNSAF